MLEFVWVAQFAERLELETRIRTLVQAAIFLFNLASIVMFLYPNSSFHVWEQ